MNVKHILFPTDLSPRSLGALDFAASLAVKLSAELHILHVDDLGTLMAMTAYSTPSFVPCCARTQVKRQLQAITPSVDTAHPRYHYVEGAPAEEICALAKSGNIDLIIMSSHGRTGLARVFLGSVAELVMRNAPCPVLVIKQPGDRCRDVTSLAVPKEIATDAIDAATTSAKRNRIVVPCDFSECSVAALSFAAQFAGPDAKIYVVHMDELLDAPASTLPPLELLVVPDSYWDRRRRKIERQLARLAPATGGAVYEFHWEVGQPAEQIIAFSERVRADLIVIGSHGRTGLSRLISGSVAEEVMRQSKCPVLVLKAPSVQKGSEVVAPRESPALRVGHDFAI